MHIPELSDNPGTAPVRVFLMHACPIVRAGLSAILCAHPEFDVSTGEQFPAQFDHATVLIAGYNAGLAAAQRTWPVQSGHAPRVLVVTQHDKEWEVRHAIDCGIHGYLMLGSSSEELVRCVKMLADGLGYICPGAMRCVVASLSRSLLTPRETDVLRVLVTGGSNKHIARELGIGLGTVKGHIKNLLSKLGATARSQAIVVALERGLLAEADTVTGFEGAALLAAKPAPAQQMFASH